MGDMNKNLFLWMSLVAFLLPLFLTAQTPTPIPTPMAPFITDLSPTPNPTPGNLDNSPLTDEIKATQDEITQLNDKKADVGLEYRHQERLYVEDLLRDKADRLRKAGHKKKAAELLKAVDDFEVGRQQEWDLDQEILEKQSHLRQLGWDRLTKVDQHLADNFTEKGLVKKANEMEEVIKFIAQMKGVEDQTLDLKKKLYKAREFYDYKTADDIRAQLKVLQDQINDLTKKMKSNVSQIENNQELNEQKLNEQNL